MSLFSQLRIDQRLRWRLHALVAPVDSVFANISGFLQALEDRRLLYAVGSESNPTLWERRREGSEYSIRQVAGPQALLLTPADISGGADRSPPASRASDAVDCTND